MMEAEILHIHSVSTLSEVWYEESFQSSY
jgi:hypothetical protein